MCNCLMVYGFHQNRLVSYIKEASLNNAYLKKRGVLIIINLNLN